MKTQFIYGKMGSGALGVGLTLAMLVLAQQPRLRVPSQILALFFAFVALIMLLEVRGEGLIGPFLFGIMFAAEGILLWGSYPNSALSPGIGQLLIIFGLLGSVLGIIRRLEQRVQSTDILEDKEVEDVFQ